MVLYFSNQFFFLLDFAQLYQVSEHRRVIETLELFPLNSFGESGSKNLSNYTNDRRDNNNNNMFSYTMREQMDHPPLDLCLSFM